MTVTVMLEGREAPDRNALNTGAGIAARMGCGVTGLCAQPDPASVVVYIATPEAYGLSAPSLDTMQKAQASVSKAAQAATLAAKADTGSDIVFASEATVPARAAVNAATLGDATIFARQTCREGGALSDAFDHVLMNARLPVILAGSEAPGDGPMIVAWDGSDTAARAVRLHLPLLKAAGHVLIAQNEGDLKKDTPIGAARPQALIDWLAGHAITSDTAPFEGGVADGLITLAEGSNAMGIVVGAYGHSRLGQRLFGGTTRALLQAERAPMLALAH